MVSAISDAIEKTIQVVFSRFEACKRSQTVVSNEGFSGDRRTSHDEFVVLGVVIRAVKASLLGDVDEAGGCAAYVRMPG